jgi:hypothetical protein
MFTTVGNVAADISSTFMLAKVENKIDEKIYREIPPSKDAEF